MPDAARKPKPAAVRYSRQLAAQICWRLAQGETLRQICRDDEMPDESAVRQWALDNRDNFAPQYARAREIQAERWADELVEIADDGTNDWQERELDSGRITAVPDHEHIMRSRLRVDTRKWLMSKVLRKKYGDKGDPEAGEDDAGTTVKIVGGLPDA